MERVVRRLLFQVSIKRLTKLPVLAEDLGVITLETLRDQFNFRGIKVLPLVQITAIIPSFLQLLAQLWFTQLDNGLQQWAGLIRLSRSRKECRFGVGWVVPVERQLSLIRLALSSA